MQTAAASPITPFELVSREEARARGLTLYFTGAPCRHGHLSQRWVANHRCRECARLKEPHYRATYQADKIDAVRAKKLAHYYANIEKRRACNKRWLIENRERHSALTAAWAKRNPGKVTHNSRCYELRKARATPPWADLERIKAIYIEAARLGLSVDHIVPLKGKKVCGLHVENNLQFLTRLDNIRKGNRFDPDA
jgi:hypothetical protein